MVKKLGESNRHFWLAQRMAMVTDTDLVQAMEKAELSQEDWAEMVRDCRGCDWEKGCERWLISQQADADSPNEQAPDLCVNREKFLSLKQALEEVDT